MAVVCASDEPTAVRLAPHEDGSEGKRNARREALAQLSKNLELSDLSFSWRRPDGTKLLEQQLRPAAAESGSGDGGGGSSGGGCGEGGAAADLMSSRRETTLEDLRQRLAARCASPEIENGGNPTTPAPAPAPAAPVPRDEEAAAEAAPIPPLMEPAQTEDPGLAMTDAPSAAQPNVEMRQLFMSAVARSLEAPSPLPMRTDSFADSKGDSANLPENDNFFANLEALKEKLAQRKMRSRSNSLVGAPLVLGGSEGRGKEEVPPSPSWRDGSEVPRACSAASSTPSVGPLYEAAKQAADTPATSSCAPPSGGESPSMPRSEARKPRAPLPSAPRGPRGGSERGGRSPRHEGPSNSKDDEALCESGGDALLAWANEVLQKAGVESTTATTATAATAPTAPTNSRPPAPNAVIGQLKSQGLQPTPPPPRSGSVRNATPRRRHFVPEGGSCSVAASAPSAPPAPTYVPSCAAPSTASEGHPSSDHTSYNTLTGNSLSSSSHIHRPADTTTTTTRHSSDPSCSSPNSPPSFPPRQSRRNNSVDAAFENGNSNNKSSVPPFAAASNLASARSPGDPTTPGPSYSGGRGLNLNMNINNLDAFLGGTPTTSAPGQPSSSSATTGAHGPLLDEAAEARKRKAEELREQWNRMSQEADTECERLASEEAANRAKFSEESDKWRDRVSNAAEELRKNVGSFAFQGPSKPPPYSYSHSYSSSSSSIPGSGGVGGFQGHHRASQPPTYPPTSARQAFGLVGPAQQAAWEQFEASWARLETMLEQSSGPISCSDIPWPSDAFCITGVLPHDSAATAKKRLAVALRRWHPDKWKRILDRVPPSEQMLVTERVKDVAQRLLVEKARLSGPGGVIR